ncbi:hypothetical protein ACIRU8_39100 [Streptomyces sp. NPDC101175]|uniref:hypothetical protein n=1 Tax=Streptomyces sp. NPDC101175 TaxID=3366123 RepID=UPI003833FDE1
MNVDLYGAWLTASNNLQPVGDWIGGNWQWLAIPLTSALFAWWAIRHDGRCRHTARARAAARHIQSYDPPTIQTEPGSDTDDLITCLHILDATHQQARKEKPQP